LIYKVIEGIELELAIKVGASQSAKILMVRSVNLNLESNFGNRNVSNLHT